MKKLGLILLTFSFSSCHHSYYLPVDGLAYQSVKSKCGNIDIALQGFLEQGYQSRVSLWFHVVLPEESVREIAPFSVQISVEDTVITNYQFLYENNWNSIKDMTEPYYKLKDQFLRFSFRIPSAKIDSEYFSIEANEFMACDGDIYDLPKVDLMNDRNVNWTKITSDIYPIGSREKEN